MNKSAAIPAALAAFFLLAAFTPQPLQPEWDDQKYYNCRETTDCVAISPPCSNIRAYNRAYAGEIQVWFDYLKQTFLPCPGWPQNGEQVAMCSTAKKCIMASPGFNVPDKADPAYCELPDDCVVVQGKCGRPIAVNRDHAAETAVDPASFATCSFIDDRVAKSVECKDHVCKAQIVKGAYASDQPQDIPPAE